MTARAFRLTAYDFSSADGYMPETKGLRFAYADNTELEFIAKEGTRKIAPGDGHFLPPDTVLRGGGWLFEMTRPEVPFLPTSVAQIELAAGIALEGDGPFFLRADGVSSSPGAATPRHGHRGPGIRRLSKGLLMAEVGDFTKRIRAGEAWFETGKEWVVGSNISQAGNTFIRVMALPAELKGGKSSFVPASPEEAAKPRAVQYRLFDEVDILW